MLNYRNLIIMLLCLLILLSGCSNDGSKKSEEPGKGEGSSSIHAVEDLNPKNKNTDSPVGDNSQEEKNVNESAKTETEGNVAANNQAELGEKNIDGKDEKIQKDLKNNIVELIPMEQLPELTLEPKRPYTEEETYGFGGVPMLTPVYHENFRYQIREFRDAYLSMDIGNTGNETLVIDDENLRFTIMDEEGNEVAGSKVQGAPVHIAPWEIKRVVVTAENPEAKLVFMDFGGIPNSVGTPVFFATGDELNDFNDTSPYIKEYYIVEDENGVKYNQSDYACQVIGNGKAKMVGLGVMAVKNEKVGPIEKGDDGFIALVKVKVANTCDEVMNIEKIRIVGGGIVIDVTEEAFAELGHKALPFTINPYSIAEGWIPFKVRDGRDGYGIVFYTSLGGFILGNLDNYPLF